MTADLGPQAFPHRISEKLRFADTDMQGHVNNAVFATLCEASRVDFLYHPERPLAPAGHQFVIARLELDFLAEIHFPGVVTIGAGVTRIGGSSFTVAQALFVEDQPVARAQSVIVLTSLETRRSAKLPDGLRAALETLALPG